MRFDRAEAGGLVRWETEIQSPGRIVLLPRTVGSTALVLVNGLAEQPETWFRNHRVWRRYFDVSMPNLFAYDGTVVHQRIEAGLPITVDFLVGQLHRHLEEFVQTPPYHLVANSMGGKIAVEYAVRYPDRVASMVLICPSGLSRGEELPIVDGRAPLRRREHHRERLL